MQVTTSVQSVSYKDKVISSRKQRIYLVESLDSKGYPMWHYLMVKERKLKSFLDAVAKKRNIEFAEYGEIIEAGFGKSPPEEIIEELRDKYGLEDCAA